MNQGNTHQFAPMNYYYPNPYGQMGMNPMINPMNMNMNSMDNQYTNDKVKKK
jgi:hypothetical protein